MIQDVQAKSSKYTKKNSVKPSVDLPDIFNMLNFNTVSSHQLSTTLFHINRGFYLPVQRMYLSKQNDWYQIDRQKDPDSIKFTAL